MRRRAPSWHSWVDTTVRRRRAQARTRSTLSSARLGLSSYHALICSYPAFQYLRCSSDVPLVAEPHDPSPDALTMCQRLAKAPPGHVDNAKASLLTVRSTFNPNPAPVTSVVSFGNRADMFPLLNRAGMFRLLQDVSTILSAGSDARRVACRSTSAAHICVASIVAAALREDGRINTGPDGYFRDFYHVTKVRQMEPRTGPKCQGGRGG